MSNTPHNPPEIGTDPWGEDLNSYLAWLEGRQDVVEQGAFGQEVKTVSAAAHTVSADDSGDLIRVTGEAPTITLPSGGLTTGQRVDFLCISAPVTFALGAGATWDVLPSSTTAADVGSFVTALKMSATTWALVGDLVYIPPIPPTLTSFTPADLSTHFGPTTLTMTGTGFSASAKVRIEGVEIPTTYVSSTTVTAVYDAVGHASGTFNVDVKQQSGTTATKPMRIADFLVDTAGVVGFALFYQFDAAKHHLTMGTYSGTFLFIGANQLNGGEQISIRWSTSPGEANWMGAPFSLTLDADKTMCSATVASVSALKMKAMPANTVYTFNAVPRFNMVFTSHTHAEIGLDPAGSSTGTNYTIFLDPSTVPGSTWETLHTPGIRIPVPFAFSATMTGGGTGWVGGTGGDGSYGFSEHVYAGAHWSVPLHSSAYGGARKGELAWLEGKTVDVEMDLTMPNHDDVTGRNYTPWKLSDPQTELIYGISSSIPGFSGSAAAAWPYIGTGLISWKTSDAPKTMYLRRHPSDTRTTTYNTNVKCFDDVDGTWKPLYKSDLTTLWTKAEIASMVDTKVALSRDISGVLTLYPVSAPTSIPWHSAFWASDPWWTPPADGVAVPTGTGWRDASGNRHDLAIVSGGPIYRATSATLNNKPAIQFDGVDDGMDSSTSFAAVALPYSLVFVVQPTNVSYNGGYARLFGGTGSSGGGAVGVENSKWYAETVVQGTTGGVANTSKHLVYASFGVGGGSNNDFYVDGVLTHHPVTSTFNVTFGKLRLGYGTASPPRYGAFNLAFFGVKVGALTAQEQAELLAWSRSFYGTP